MKTKAEVQELYEKLHPVINQVGMALNGLTLAESLLVCSFMAQRFVQQGLSDGGSYTPGQRKVIIQMAKEKLCFGLDMILDQADGEEPPTTSTAA